MPVVILIAHMLYNIAVANGSKGSELSRELLERKMSPQTIEKAQAMARKCMASNYKECGY